MELSRAYKEGPHLKYGFVIDLSSTLFDPNVFDQEIRKVGD